MGLTNGPNTGFRPPEYDASGDSILRHPPTLKDLVELPDLRTRPLNSSLVRQIQAALEALKLQPTDRYSKDELEEVILTCTKGEGVFPPQLLVALGEVKKIFEDALEGKNRGSESKPPHLPQSSTP